MPSVEEITYGAKDIEVSTIAVISFRVQGFCFEEIYIFMIGLPDETNLTGSYERSTASCYVTDMSLL